MYFDSRMRRNGIAPYSYLHFNPVWDCVLRKLQRGEESFWTDEKPYEIFYQPPLIILTVTILNW